VWALTRGGDGASTNDAAPTTSAPASSAPGAETAFVDSTNYVGEPVDDVEQILTDQGLEVVTEEATAAQLAELGRALDAGDVVTTDPFAQDVPLGSAVTLFYAADAFAPGTGDEDPATTEEPPAQQTTQAPPRTTTPAPSTPRGSGTTSPAPATSTSAAATTTASSPPVDEDDELPGEPAPAQEPDSGPGAQDPDGSQDGAQGQGARQPDTGPPA
jgi:serine/threonine-protein kinase